MAPDLTITHATSASTVTPERLRDTIEVLTYQCPRRSYATHCPFGRFSGLSPSTRRSLLANLSSERLTALFELTSPCQCPADPRSQSQQNDRERIPLETLNSESMTTEVKV